MGSRTVDKVLRSRFLQSQIVDPPMRRIILRLPVELLEEVGTGNRQFTCITRGRATHDACERKSEGQGGAKREMAQSAHGDCSCVEIITWCAVRGEWITRERVSSQCASEGRDRRWSRGGPKLGPQKERQRETETKRSLVEKTAASSCLCTLPGEDSKPVKQVDQSPTSSLQDRRPTTTPAANTGSTMPTNDNRRLGGGKIYSGKKNLRITTWTGRSTLRSNYNTCVSPSSIPKEVSVERFGCAIVRFAFDSPSAGERAACWRPRRRRTIPRPPIPDP
jgi:hypothetical protein